MGNKPNQKCFNVFTLLNSLGIIVIIIEIIIVTVVPSFFFFWFPGELFKMQMILALWIITEREDAWLIWPLPYKNTHVHMKENKSLENVVWFL